MPMGDYDEDEHERRAEKARVDAEFDDERTEYRGEVSFDDGADTDDLLDQFHELQED